MTNLVLHSTLELRPLIWVAVIIMVVRGVAARPLSRHLMEDLLEKRHSHPIPDHVADASYPRSIWSEFMLSPCRPEDSGYFGSTHVSLLCHSRQMLRVLFSLIVTFFLFNQFLLSQGTPILLQYGFEMETSHYPNIEKALKVIDEKVMDALLSHFFPTICGFDGSHSTTHLSTTRRFDAEITGFRFSKELIDMTRKFV